MDKKEAFAKAFAVASDNLAVAGVEKEVARKVIAEEMERLLKKENIEFTVDELKAFIKEQVTELDEAVSDYTVGPKSTHI
jgi:hypothetical protein